MVKIGILIDSTTSHEISYDGFSKNSFGDPVTNVTAVTEEPLYKYFAAASNVDMYNASSTQKGFRIKGGIKLKHIFGSDIGGEQSTPHTLQYTYERDPFMGTPPTATSNAVKIYIDSLTHDPTVANNGTSDTAIVKSVMWCMGIPSVNEMTITLHRTYSNINTANGFIRGDGKIGEISSITGTNYTGVTSDMKYILSKNDINNFGKYNKSYKKDGVKYTESRTNINATLPVTEKAYSLENTNGVSSSSIEITNLKHYCDFNSFNNSQQCKYS